MFIQSSSLKLPFFSNPKRISSTIAISRPLPTAGPDVVIQVLEALQSRLKGTYGQLFLNTFSKQLGFVWVFFQKTTFRKWWSWIMVGNHHCWYMITFSHVASVQISAWIRIHLHLLQFFVGGKTSGDHPYKSLGKPKNWTTLQRKHASLYFTKITTKKTYAFQKRYVFLVQGLLLTYLTLHGCRQCRWGQPYYCCCPSTTSPFFKVVIEGCYRLAFNASVLVDLFGKNTTLFQGHDIPLVSHTLKLKL